MSDDLEIEANLAAVIEPLRVQLAGVEKVIGEKSAELDTLRAGRAKLKKALAFFDPASVPAKAAKAKTTPAGRVSADTVAAVEKRLHDEILNVNGNGGFTVTSLRRDHGFGNWPQSTLQKSIAVLYERDLLRLDHRGRGGAHYYKVVA